MIVEDQKNLMVEGGIVLFRLFDGFIVLAMLHLSSLYYTHPHGQRPDFSFS